MTNIQTDATVSPMLVVAAALIDGAGRVLLQQRAPGRSMAGLWEFPGGKVEPREASAAALCRELAEELGIAVDPDELTPIAFSTGTIGDRALVLLLYACRRWTGEPNALDAVALAWRAADELDADTMPPADRPLLDPLRRLLAARP